jgi:hypothetical protein
MSTNETTPGTVPPQGVASSGLAYAVVSSGLRVIRETVPPGDLDLSQVTRPGWRPSSIARALGPGQEPKSETSSQHIARWFKDQGIGRMRTLVGTVIFIVAWLIAGQFFGFDKNPWLILLLLINLVEVPIMIVLQISANVAEEASNERDRREAGKTALLLAAMDEILRRIPPQNSTTPPPPAV